MTEATTKPPSPLDLPSPINQVNLVTITKGCATGDRVVAGYIPDDDPTCTQLSVMFVTIDKALDAKYQQVWDEYVLDPTKEHNLKAMELYNVAKFKPHLVVLAGVPQAIEAAKQQGLKTHPEMRVLKELPLPVTAPGEDEQSGLPPRAVTTPSAAAIEAAAAQTSAVAVTEDQDNENYPPPPHPTLHVAKNVSNPRKRRSGDPAPTAADAVLGGPSSDHPPPQIDNLTSTAIDGLKPVDAVAVRSLLEIQPLAGAAATQPPPSDTPPIDSPAEPLTHTRVGRYLTRSAAKNKQKFGPYSIETDLNYYTDYDSAVTAKAGPSSDAMESLLASFFRARYLRVRLPIIWDVGVMSRHVVITHSWTYSAYRKTEFSEHESANEAKIIIATDPGQRLIINVEGTAHVLDESIEYSPDDFKMIHDQVAQRVQRTDQTLRYLKGWLYYFSALGLEQMAEQLPAPQYTPVIALVGVQPASTIYHDDPHVANPPQTRQWLNATLAENNCPYYAKLGTGNDTIIVDALMNAPYPVYSYEMVNNAAGANHPNRAPIPATVRFNSEPNTSHHTYTNDPATHARGVVPAAGGPSVLHWNAAPPPANVIFTQMFAIAQANMETDSWFNGMLLATQYLLMNRMPALGNQRAPLVLPFLDCDVISIGYANPVYRAAQAFNYDETPPPPEPNAKTLIGTPHHVDLRLYQYIARSRSYARSVTLAAFNWNGSALNQVPVRGRAGLHPMTIGRIAKFYPTIGVARTMDHITRMTPNVYQHVFGFTLPFTDETVISRYCTLPVAAHRNTMTQVGQRVPHIVKSWQLHDMIVRLPIESGMYDVSVCVNFQHSAHQLGHNNAIDTFYPREEADFLWDNVHAFPTPIWNCHIALRHNYMGLRTTWTTIEQPICVSMDKNNAPPAVAVDRLAHVQPDPGHGNWYQPGAFEFEDIVSDFSLAAPVMHMPVLTLLNPNAPATTVRTATLVHLDRGQHKSPYRGLIAWHGLFPSAVNMIGHLVHPTLELPETSDSAFAPPGQKRQRTAATITAPPVGPSTVEDGYADNKRGNANK
jgi:hypothetical protein